MTPEELIFAYNAAVFEVPGWDAKISPATLAHAQRYLEWCAERKVDPVLFIRYRHHDWQTRQAPRRYRNGFRIGIGRLPMRDLSAFRAWGERVAATAAGESRFSRATVHDTDLTIGLTYLSEALKATMLGNRRACLLSRETRGWHPASEHCRTCEIAQACRENLPDRTRALREGLA